MMNRTRLVVGTATLAVLAATGPAAASGSTPTPGPVRSDSATVKVDGRSKADDGLAAVAAKLGVTTDRLAAALVAVKRSLAGSADVTTDTIVAAVAANLELPVPQVQDALGSLIGQPGPTSDNNAKKDSKDHEGVDRSRNSPFSTEAAAASVAAALGVDQAKAKEALDTVMALGVIDPSSKAFGDIAASLGVSSDRLAIALRTLKQPAKTKG